MHRWVDIEDPREQFEAALGIELEEWQWDYIEHLRRGERLVPYGPRGSRWIPDDRLKKDDAGPYHPITEDRIREIAREEISRSKADSAGYVHVRPNGG